ncbi:MAG: hypothetical protein FGM46_02310 [Ferruginibacter sp.]|nr:hypothetical protein [Ferruginibacter sp.]
MKIRNILCLFLALSYVTSFAQEEDTEEGNEKFFKKENLFTGGTLNLSFGNRITNIGVSPFFGYSLNRYIDVAGTICFNYVSERDAFVVGDKLRQTIFGPGAFVRVFPFDFVFAQVQYEYNIMANRYSTAPTSTFNIGNPNFDAHSLLVGGGYTNGKFYPTQKSYYYFSVLWDVGNAIYSPYKDNFRRSVPIIRAGFNIALFQGYGRRRR